MTQQDIHDFMTAQGFTKIDDLEIWYLRTGGTNISVWNADDARIMLQLTLEARRDEREHTAKVTTDVCSGIITADFAMAVSNERLAELNNQLSKDKEQEHA